jgi:GNAT superfamily N-acetyltransferase
MIKTQLTRADALEILELGRQFHQESQFKDQVFQEEKCWAILNATLLHPEKYFIAYDDQFKGLLLMQMSAEFFSDSLWAADHAFYVTPEERGGGLGKELLEAGEKWAKEKGAAEMVIFHNAGIRTETAEKFYTALGYQLSGLIFKKSFLVN